MEEKLKASDSQSEDSELQLFQQCQDLRVSVQEKEKVVTQLAQQLEEQVNNSSHEKWNMEKSFIFNQRCLLLSY